MTEITTEIVQSLAAAEGVDPSELDIVLHEYLDPDAVNRLFQNSTDVALTATIEGHRVTVDSDESVTVERRQTELTN